MKQDMKKIFLLTSLVLLMVGLSAVSAADSDSSDVQLDDVDTDVSVDTITTDDDNTETSNYEYSSEVSSLKGDETTEYTVNTYTDLVSKVNEIKTSTVDADYTINLEENSNESAYYITEPITWGDENQVVTSLTINGNGVTLNGQNSTYFLTVSENYTVTINDLAITNCSSSGINNNGQLLVTNSLFDNNYCIERDPNYGYVSGGSGAGIYSSGNLTVINTTFSNSYAASGAGAYIRNGTSLFVDCIFENLSTEWYMGDSMYIEGGYVTLVNINSNGIQDGSWSGAYSKYLSSSTTSITMDVASSSSQVSQNVIVSGVLTDENGTALANANVTLTSGDYTATTVTGDDGSYTFDYTEDEAGVYDVYVTSQAYLGDNAYYYSSDKSAQVVFIANTIISVVADVSTTSLGSNVTITGTLKDENDASLVNENVKVVVNDGEAVDVMTDENGAYTYTFTATIVGENNITVSYEGSELYTASSNSTSVTVEKMSTVITTSDIEGTYKDTAILTAYVTDSQGNPVSEGQVAFKLNDVVIKDADGNAILVDVVDGVATLEYSLTNNVGTYNITGLYYGSSNYLTAKSTENSTLTITNRDVSITILPLDDNLKSGQTITITVLISDEGKLVDGGAVIFKLNGVTIKNTDGGNLNATVSNGVATVTYTIPVDYAAKDYNLTTVYSNKNYNRAEDNSILSLVKSNMTTTVSPLYITQGENTTLSLTLYDQNSNLVNRTTKINIKANGKTIVSTTAENGVVNIDLPTDTFKNNYYNITIILGENSAYNGLTLNTILIVNKDDNATKIE